MRQDNGNLGSDYSISFASNRLCRSDLNESLINQIRIPFTIYLAAASSTRRLISAYCEIRLTRGGQAGMVPDHVFVITPFLTWNTYN